LICSNYKFPEIAAFYFRSSDKLAKRFIVAVKSLDKV